MVAIYSPLQRIITHTEINLRDSLQDVTLINNTFPIFKYFQSLTKFKIQFQNFFDSNCIGYVSIQSLFVSLPGVLDYLLSGAD